MKLKEKLTNYFKNRPATFYFAFATACLTFVSSIIYVSMFAGSELISWGAFVCAFLALFAFFALSLFDMPKIGAISMAVLSFTAFIMLLISAYSFVYDEVNIIAMGSEASSEFINMAVCVALYLITFIFANICAWLRLVKRPKEENNG